MAVIDDKKKGNKSEAQQLAEVEQLIKSGDEKGAEAMAKGLEGSSNLNIANEAKRLEEEAKKKEQEIEKKQKEAIAKESAIMSADMVGMGPKSKRMNRTDPLVMGALGTTFKAEQALENSLGSKSHGNKEKGDLGKHDKINPKDLAVIAKGLTGIGKAESAKAIDKPAATITPERAQAKKEAPVLSKN